MTMSIDIQSEAEAEAKRDSRWHMSDQIDWLQHQGRVWIAAILVTEGKAIVGQEIGTTVCPLDVEKLIVELQFESS